MEIGKCYLFMTVTHYITGRVTAFDPGHVTLDDAAWIPNTGRLSDCIERGTVDECEPIGNGVIVPRGSTIIIPWKHVLPTKVK